MSAVIQTQNLTKFYGKFKGIQDVSLTINKGEFYGFIGPNGAGKSTIIRSLLGLLKPTSGNATIFGKEINVAGAQIRQKIGYLPSEVNYYDEMDSRELLEYSARFYANVDASQIDTLAERLDLNLNKKITDLSFGNKKKCAIIQCLLHKPEILILDEPTSGLDPLIQNRFFDLLKEQNELGVTILYSSHVLSEIQRLCTRTAVIKEGEIVTIEEMGKLLLNKMKRVTLQFPQANKDILLPEGGKDPIWQENKLTFRFIGEMNVLLDWISKQSPKDVTIENPDLESIFMNYYKR